MTALAAVVQYTKLCSWWKLNTFIQQYWKKIRLLKTVTLNRLHLWKFIHFFKFPLHKNILRQIFCGDGPMAVFRILRVLLHSHTNFRLWTDGEIVIHLLNNFVVVYIQLFEKTSTKGLSQSLWSRTKQQL